MIRQLRTWLRKISQPFNPPEFDHVPFHIEQDIMYNHIKARWSSGILDYEKEKDKIRAFTDEFRSAFLMQSLHIHFCGIDTSPIVNFNNP